MPSRSQALGDVHGSRVMVTGASRGIGKAITREFARAGAHVTLVARDPDRLADIAGEIGGDVLAGDLLDPDFVDGVAAVLRADPGVDVLVNNAALEHTGTLDTQDPEQIRDVFHLNLVVPAQLSQAALVGMLTRGRGHIVNVSSISMCADTPGFATYGASKSGLSALGESVRRELYGTGVGLTTVEVGYVDTDMLDELRTEPLTGGVFDRYEQLRLQRTLPVDEVASAVRRAVERNSPHVRLPRRSAAFPMITNLPRRLGRVIQRGVRTR